mgnify:CR=1 FL=1
MSVCERCFEEVLDSSDHGLNKCPLQPRPAGFGVIGDDIPGGLVVKHLDKTPKRYYSKTDIKRAANERGWVIAGDSPRPYKVPWSGRVNEPWRQKDKPRED